LIAQIQDPPRCQNRSEAESLEVDWAFDSKSLGQTQGAAIRLNQQKNNISTKCKKKKP